LGGQRVTGARTKAVSERALCPARQPGRYCRSHGGGAPPGIGTESHRVDHDDVASRSKQRQPRFGVNRHRMARAGIRSVGGSSGRSRGSTRRRLGRGPPGPGDPVPGGPVRPRSGDAPKKNRGCRFPRRDRRKNGPRIARASGLTRLPPRAGLRGRNNLPKPAGKSNRHADNPALHSASPKAFARRGPSEGKATGDSAGTRHGHSVHQHRDL